jgi:hypothetical protein
MRLLSFISQSELWWIRQRHVLVTNRFQTNETRRIEFSDIGNWHSHAKLWSCIMLNLRQTRETQFYCTFPGSADTRVALVAMVHIKQPSNGEIKFERQPNEEWRPISRRARAFLWNLTTRNWLIFHAAELRFGRRGLILLRGICQTPFSLSPYFKQKERERERRARRKNSFFVHPSSGAPFCDAGKRLRARARRRRCRK